MIKLTKQGIERMSKMKEGSKAYNLEAIELALSNISIYPCIDCGHPLEEGLCCAHCGSGNGHNEDCERSEPNYTPQAS